MFKIVFLSLFFVSLGLSQETDTLTAKRRIFKVEGNRYVFNATAGRELYVALRVIAESPHDTPRLRLLSVLNDKKYKGRHDYEKLADDMLARLSKKR